MDRDIVFKGMLKLVRLSLDQLSERDSTLTKPIHKRNSKNFFISRFAVGTCGAEWGNNKIKYFDKIADR